MPSIMAQAIFLVAQPARFNGGIYYSKISLVRYGLFSQAYCNTKGIIILHTYI